MCHTLILRSSAERKVQSSLLTDIELMWYVWAFEKILRGAASIEMSSSIFLGILSFLIMCLSLRRPSSVNVLKSENRLHLSVIFHSLIVLSEEKEREERKKKRGRKRREREREERKGERGRERRERERERERKKEEMACKNESDTHTYTYEQKKETRSDEKRFLQ